MQKLEDATVTVEKWGWGNAEVLKKPAVISVQKRKTKKYLPTTFFSQDEINK